MKTRPSVFEANLFGHEQVVHQAITFNAAKSAYTGSSAYADFLNDLFCEEFRDIGPVVLPADDVSISADGKRLSVQMSATDCYDRGGLIGWEPVIIKWKAWYGDNP